ncbi:hypothetical protein [Bremerella sp. P1]|uniref:hypothetical protein n=1 Tax=Bremerella sp. P1 TaxID=3026424 RepID=UPI002368F1A0|nr:hypothetical protein [Bremerella sp. P1]WDI40429.1 hypothetical protein PSR63_18285 [Bremerella sp. P1]
MSHHHAIQPEKHGAGSPEHAPQVAVRDGNRLLCPCCGEVLLYLSADQPREEPLPPPEPSNRKPPGMRPSPWEAIAWRQDAIQEAAWEAFNESRTAEQEALHTQFVESDDPEFCANYLTEPIDAEVAAYEFPVEDPPPLPSRKRTRPPRKRNSEARHNKRAPHHGLPLEEPYTYQEKRYLAWSFYHLKVQDLELQAKIRLKQAKIDCLRRDAGGDAAVLSYEKYLPNKDVPKVRPRVEVIEFDLMHWVEHVTRDQRSPSYESIRLKTLLEQVKERGPP